MITRSLIISLFVLAFASVEAQNVPIANGGFEGTPHFGQSNSYSSFRPMIDGWFDCGRVEFPAETPPDLHQGAGRDTAFWKNTQSSVQGKTYLGMVVRNRDTYESLSQRLALPLMAGKCYKFSVYLSRSDTYMSPLSNVEGSKEENFTTPTVFRLWAGNGLCDYGELLVESPPIDHSEWKEYSFRIEPSANFQFIRIEAFYETPVLFAYNGHILVDQASDFELIPCDELVELYVQETLEKQVTQRRMPAHKAKKRNTEIYARQGKDVKVDTIVMERPKEKILALDRNSMTKGQNIRIDKLYFEADTSAINIESFQVLNELYDFLADNLDINVEIGGHTNNIPSHDYCNKLSTDRAKAVAEYLIKKGIEEERISYRGYGKRKPIASNGTAEGRKKNQRVEIKIVSIG